MNPQEIEKLLGGYATDTLTEEERRTLFEAALANQTLFDALADEQALRELLDDPPSRAQLLATLREERVSPLSRFAAWMRQPSAIALAAAVAAGIVTVAVVIPRKTLEKPTMVAMKPAPPPAPRVEMQAPPENAPVPPPAPKPAAAAPSGSPTRSALHRTDELKPDVVMRRDTRASGGMAVTRRPAESQTAPATTPAAAPVVAAPAEPAAVAPAPAAATPPPPPPPAQTAVSTAKSQFQPSEEKQQAQSKVAASAAPAGAAGGRQEARKEAAPPGARDLYYAARTSTAAGFLDTTKSAGKAKQSGTSGSFGRNLSLQRMATPPAPVIGGVRYSIQRRNPDGSFVEVEPSAIFAPGDALRVRFETNQAGNLAVMERQADGKWTLRMAAHTQAGEPVYMPSESTIDVKAPGTFRFFVRFSRSLRSDARLDQVAATPNLLRESAANSVYVVNPAAATDPVVDFELAITAR